MLYLVAHGPDRGYWILRYRRNGRLREMGLGRARGRNAVTLAEARTRAAELVKQVRAGIDPLSQRDADRAAARAAAQTETARAVTFESAAALYIDAIAPGDAMPSTPGSGRRR